MRMMTSTLSLDLDETGAPVEDAGDARAHDRHEVHAFHRVPGGDLDERDRRG